MFAQNVVAKLSFKFSIKENVLFSYYIALYFEWYNGSPLIVRFED